MEEIFRDVKGYPNYCVSNYGNVKNTKTGKILKPETDLDGYLRVRLYKDGNGKKYKIHRLVAMVFIPNTDNLPCINHKDENKTRNFVYINEDGTVDLEKSNIEWCTVKYNNNYGTRTERMAKAQKGKFVSEEIRKKLSLALKGRKRSEEAIQKTVAKQINGKKSKPVLQIDPLTNEIIAEFPSVAEVKRQLGFMISHVSDCCNGRLKTYKGFKWNYKT